MKRNIRLLLVEDNEDDADLLLATLRHAGFDLLFERIDTAESMRAALERSPWDILISDYSLPRFSGLAALKILKASGLDIPAIIISGTVGEETAVETLQLGAEDYLLKQNLTRLIPAVDRALQEAENRRQRRAAEQMNSLIMSNSLDVICVLDKDGHYRQVSRAAERVWGYAVEDLSGKRVLDYIHPEDSATVSKKFEQAILGRPAHGFECRMLRKDGTICHTMWSSYWSPKEALIFAVARDITERKEAEVALLKSEEAVRSERSLLRALIDSIPDLIFFKDRDSVFLGCNKAFEKHLGIKEADLAGCNDFALVPPEVARFYRRKDQDLFVSGKTQRMEEWIPSRDGRGGFYETVKTAYFGPEGETLGIIGVSRDITERKQAEENMRTVLDRLRIAARAAQAGIWELDLRTNEGTWDDQMCILFGLDSTKADTSTPQWFQLMHPEDIPRYHKALEEAQKHYRDSFDIEFRITRADNQQERLIQTQALVKRDAQGIAVGLIGTNRDVTEERLREKELANALAQEKELAEKARAGERAKGEFLAVMSHELRTPMNGILGFAELLSRSTGMPGECKEYAQTILHSGEALLRILDDILDFSRLEDGHLKIETTSFSPRKLIQDTHLLLERQARSKHLEFEGVVDEAVPESLEGDAGRIRQILLNLLGNAIKFTDSGSVTLELRVGEALADGFWRFEFRVRDTGSGIPADKIDAIFHPITQADSSISRRHGGTGLGLTISRRLTEMLGGTLTVESEVGVGSEFLAAIPLTTSQRPIQACLALPSDSVNIFLAAKYPLHILVVEDDKVNLKLIQALIGKLGYASMAARNGQQAIDLFRVERPDCVLMDLQMPEIGGIEATEKIREMETSLALPQTFICALTANIFPADRQRCFKAGLNGYLNKPVKITSLAETLIEAAKFRRHRTSTP